MAAALAAMPQYAAHIGAPRVDAIGVVTAASHWLPVGGSTFEVVVVIGMAVGVDYSLFFLRASVRSGQGAARSPTRCGSPGARRAAPSACPA